MNCKYKKLKDYLKRSLALFKNSSVLKSLSLFRLLAEEFPLEEFPPVLPPLQPPLPEEFPELSSFGIWL